MDDITGYPRQVEEKLLSAEEFTERLAAFDFNNDKSRLITFTNPVSYHRLPTLPEFLKIDEIYSDGLLLTMLHRFSSKSENFRRASFDFSSVASDVFRNAVARSLRVTLIGGTPTEAEAARANIASRFPGLQIAHSRSGFFDSDAAEAEFIAECSDANVFIIGMGFPAQERFGARLKESYAAGKLIYTCGAFLTQTSIREDYYYPLFKKFGLRWLQRALENSHVRKRLIYDYPLFLLRYLSSNSGRRETANQNSGHV